MKDQKGMRPAQIRLGILGGGQLARMLALEAAPLGLEVHVFTEKPDDPAAQVCHHIHTKLVDFYANVDLVTFESEFFDMKKAIDIERDSKVKFFPKPSVLEILQDRSTQKKLLIDNGLPTAQYRDVGSYEDLQKVAAQFQYKLVLKKCRGGYDGYGTYHIKSERDIEGLQKLFPDRFIAESFIDFKQELAITLVRSSDGTIAQLPLVTTKQVQSRCDWVFGPTHHPKEKTLTRKLKNFIEKIDYVGAISFEIFDSNHQLLINELAPRVHNSAHYSQDALTSSQFELHVRAGLGEKLRNPETRDKMFCMINLIGQGSNPMVFPLNITGKLHWYGKKESRPGRKMGHINYLGVSFDELLKKGLSERKKFQI